MQLKYLYVLNLIINGLPSILRKPQTFGAKLPARFKPYYKWITFNTAKVEFKDDPMMVLNLIINGLPSIRILIWTQLKESSIVLNLIINGLPSIQLDLDAESVLFLRFKPYYKWITFNTDISDTIINMYIEVLNLIINGLPSILQLNNFR